MLLFRFLPASARRPDGLVHIAVGFFAGVAVAGVATLEVLKVVLKKVLAGLAQTPRTRFVQGGFCFLLGILFRLRSEVLDGVEGAPVDLVLPLALARHRLLQRVNQQIVKPQNEEYPSDPEDQEPLVHAAERIASPNLIPAYSPLQPPGLPGIPLRAGSYAVFACGDFDFVSRFQAPSYFAAISVLVVATHFHAPWSFIQVSRNRSR